MSEQFNPVTKTVSRTVPVTNPPSLQSICRNTILHAITLKRIKQADESLPLPKPLMRTVSVLNLKDFVIDAEKLDGINHQKQSYPATCIFDGIPCIIKVKSKGIKPELDNPSFMTSFEDKNSVCCVYEATDTLKDRIVQCKLQNTRFQEVFIWRITKTLLEFALNGKITTSSKVNSSMIHFYGPKGIIFLEEDDNPMTEMVGADSAIYEAPEVLRQEEPNNQAFSWTVGCIIYEMLALEPAFFDRTGTNPFQVFMDMMQGQLPPEPTEGSPEIIEIMWHCFKTNPAQRIPPEDLLRFAIAHSE